MKIDKNEKILIVGLGLIGGSYAQGLSQAGYHVEAISKNEEDISFAINHGYIKNGCVSFSKDYVSQFDLVIFALYPTVFLSWIKSYQSYFKSGALISDVTGVKTKIVYEIQSLLRSDCEFVAAHPMAGKEVTGVQNADCSIFKNANYIVTPTDKNTKEAVEKIKSVGEVLGFKNIAELSPEKHDEMIGFLSQLTHCIAMSLMTCQDSTHYENYTGDSFRDLTRIARINENLWPELFLLNKEGLINEINIFEKALEELKEAISGDDKEKIKELMILSTERRKAFDKK